MSSDLRDKLRRLGVHKGTRAVSPPRAKPGRQGGIESLVDGHLVETPYGAAFVHEESYTADHPHGGHRLGELLSLPAAIAAHIGNEPELAKTDLSRLVFLDTETTGLSGGTGTFAFLVGVGTFDLARSAFVLRQYFLRSPIEEPAMLHALAEWLDSFDAVVSFNGRGFDMPLLESRFTLARMRPQILRAPHLDLLMPSRRLWRDRLESCRLSSLEQYILNVQREQDDVPGFLIPEMYMRYVHSGDASEMPRVLYHNAIDILSMVSLSTRLMTLMAASTRMRGDARERLLDAGDWLALGKWHDDLGRVEDAESALRECLAGQPDAATRATALHRLGHLLKRSNRRAEAVRVWQALSDTHTWQGVEACIELAKHYEWHEVNLERAAVWTREAMAIVGALSDGYMRDRLDAALTHRMRRLKRKR